MIKIFKKEKQRGFSLVEMVVYVGLVSVLLLIVFDTLFAITGSYRSLLSARQVQSAGVSSLDRIMREVRDAKSIDFASSIFSASSSVLRLNTTNVAGTARTVEFFLLNGAVRMKENGVDVGPLTTKEATTTALIFNSISSIHSHAVKAEVHIESGSGNFKKEANWYSTAVLRDSY